MLIYRCYVYEVSLYTIRTVSIILNLPSVASFREKKKRFFSPGATIKQQMKVYLNANTRISLQGIPSVNTFEMLLYSVKFTKIIQGPH